ncbi:MAG: HIT family protein [Bryobacterales bacterium]|nr:HIT family protein [Bryobacteraceae bacterium]MDW8354501.1 HIT family protein [Bryobacterales bacterium]
MSAACKFCQIVERTLAAQIVFEDEVSLAFLDHRPLFPGHTLLVPRRHCETLSELAAEMVAPLFANVRLLARAVEKAMSADGSFVAINNRVSQSVPHLHVHLVPRRHKDGLRGFFWPRQKYESSEAAARVAEAIRQAIASLQHADM